MKKVKKSFTMDEDVYAELKSRAKKDRISMSSFLNTLLATTLQVDQEEKEPKK